MNKIKGDAYECYICDYLNKGDSVAYLWKNIPPKLLVDSNMFKTIDVIRKNKIALKNNSQLENCQNLFMDVGIDILQIINGKFIFIQCKCGYEKNGVGIHDLNGFFMQLCCNPDKMGAIYFTDKLNKHVNDANERCCNVELKCIQMPFNYDATNIEPSNKIIQLKYQLHDYQQKAVNDLTTHFTTNNRGILSFPCACGKTITSYYLSLNYKYVFIVSPYKCHAEQNLSKFEEYDEKKCAKYILINSNGCRNVPKILKMMKENNRIVMSSTFDSVDVVNLLIASVRENYIVIVDEFHNLSKADVGIYDKYDDDEEEENEPEQTQNEMNKLITTANKILFVSATPKVYEIEGLENDDFNKNLFGENVATMTFNEAITKKYITDYKIYIPSVGEKYDDLTTDIETEININLVKDEILAKCMFLMKGFCNNGNKKCIMYCRSVEEIAHFQTMFQTLDAYYALDLKYYTIVADTKNRNEIIQQFSNDVGNSIIFSIRVLDEAIDIASCDSIYISYSSEALVRNVQRVFRCNRIDKNNPNKIGHVYVYCDEYRHILNVFASLKEYDSIFVDKIEIMNMKLNETKEIKRCNTGKNKILIDNFLINVKEFVVNNFDEMLIKASNYFDENQRVLTCKGEEFNKLFNWVHNQKKRANLMCMEQREKWDKFVTKYGEFLRSRKEMWLVAYKNSDVFITTNGHLPSSKDVDKNVSHMGKWIMAQHINYADNIGCIKNDVELKKMWEIFIEKHSQHFLDNITIWNNNFLELNEFFEKYNRRPECDSVDDDTARIGRWISSQNKNYKNNTMKNDEIKDKWKKFLEKYENFFLDNVVVWEINYKLVDEFMEKSKNHCRPSSASSDAETRRLGRWVTCQLQNYKNRDYIMKDEHVYQQWAILTKKYKQQFSDYITKWFMALNDVEKYMETSENNDRPSKANFKTMAAWLCAQVTKYQRKSNIMKIPEIYEKWEEFVLKYPTKFSSTHKIIMARRNNCA